MSNSTQEHNNEKLSMDELQRISVEEFKQSAKLPITVILIMSESNEQRRFSISHRRCFSLEHICLCGITAQPPHKEKKKQHSGHRIGELVLLSDTHEAYASIKHKL